MRIIVDANIIFSAILNSDGKIGELLINSQGIFQFIAPDFLRYEIKNKYPKLQSISKLSIEQILEAEYQVCKDVIFISEEQINHKYWVEAKNLVADIEINDVHYVAYAKQFDCKIWSGDKKLFRGLTDKGFIQLISTQNLLDLRGNLQ